MQPSLRTHLSSNDINIDLRRILDFIAQSCKYIANEIQKSNRQLAGTVNPSGEQQLALDVIADQMLLERLKKEKSFSIRDFVSEEQDQVITLDTSYGRFSVTVDPLDGSSLVDVNLSIGTIIGVHEGPIMEKKKGYDTMVAAMYIVYGPLTSLVYTAKKGTHEFVLDTAGNFVLTKENITMKEKGSIYSIGALRGDWLPEHKSYIEELENQRYKLRYSGGFVPDINQLLLKGGGLFTYPSTKKDKNGKLRLLFELQPMALLIEQAGGLATDGKRNILDIIPSDLNQRSAVYIGSKNEVELVKQYLGK
jgi:fructose-1,6-bisphosphatase I